MILIRKHSKNALKYLVILTLLVTGGYSVLAQFSGDAFVVKTVHVFPAEINAEGWNNLETLTFQNLDEYALLSDFNAINSATMQTSPAILNQLERSRDEEQIEITDLEVEVEEESELAEVMEVSTSTLDIEDEVSEELVEQNSSSSVEFGVVTEEAESASALPSSQTSTTPVVEVESSDEVTETEVEVSATTTVMKRVSSLFKLAVESITTFTSSSTESDEISDESEEVIEEIEEVAETVAEEIVEELSEIATTSEEVTEEILEDQTETIEAEEILEETEAVDGGVSAGVNSTTTTNEVENENEVEVETATTSEELMVEDCEEDCSPFVISLNNFAFPLETGVEITGAQLRMSFAADKKATRDRTPLFETRYSINGGATWEDSGVIVIDGEVSNSVNGGYYLFALPSVTDQDSIDSLQVELKYHDNPEIVEELFVESVWLELFTLEPPEDIGQPPLAELLANDGYNPDLLAGDMLELPSGEVLNFDFTDENSNETLIIKSNAETYQGVSEATTYFSVTNIGEDADDIQIQAYFPDNVGEVTGLEVFNQNKPREEVVPDFRPYVYHCEAGWEYAGEFEAGSLQDLSQYLSLPDLTELTNNPPVDQVEEISTTTSEIEPEPEFSLPTTSSSSVLEVNIDDDASNTTTTVLNRLQGVTQLLQLSTLEPVSSEIVTENAPTSTDENDSELQVEEASDDVVISENLVAGYECRNTNIVRHCDELDGENTSCRVDQVKIAEHRVTKFSPGWDSALVEEEGMPEPGFFRRVVEFIGFGPDRKDVPDTFEARVHTPDTYEIQPGETLYFKMEIAFPPFTNGEYWIEAIGDSEYGLLDPFWSSQWIYRLPITIDNTTSSQTLTEQQVFIEIDNSLTDFWTNVNDDGGDIRFIQETVVGNIEDWYGTGWNRRTPITVQASQIDENLTDFPVYVDLADLGTTFFNNVQTNGGDIRVTEADGETELPYELVAINTGSETGELHFKANAVSSSTDTTFYIYYENPNVNGYSETDTYGAQNVWNTDYIAVYHMEEAAAGRGNTGLYQDSTDNEYDADDELNSSGKTGQLGQGQEIDAQGDASEYLLLPSDIVNSETQLTFSYWFNSSEANNQALINGGANNEYLIFMQSGGTVMNLFPGGTPTVADVSIAPAWRHVMVSRDTTANEWRIFIDGVEDNDSPSAQSLSTLSIPANCLVVGLEQDTSCLNSGDTTQHTNGFIDEMRFYNVVPSDGEISATYRNQATTTDFYNVGTIDTLTVTNFVELDHWVQHFSTTTQESDIWVQVDSLAASASTTIYLYYGSPGATSASDEEATFTYSTTTDLYYVVDGNSTGGINVYSLIDNNEVSIDGGTTVSLNEGEVTTFSTYSSTSVISALGPISATVNDARADTVAPIAFASTTHAMPTNRGTSEYFIHSPFASTTVRTYLGSSGTPDQTLNIATSSTAEPTTDAGGSDGVIIEATSPVLVFHHTATQDSMVLYPPTTRDIFGIDSNNLQITTLTDDPDPSYYCSSGASGSSTGILRGEEQGDNFCTQGNEGVGDAVRYADALYPIAAIQQADSDGGESTAFWPQHEFGTQFFMPTDSAYAAVVCSPRFGTSTIEVQNNSGTTVQSATCAPNGELPGKAYFDNSLGGDALAFTAGHQVVSTNGVPFYVIYEDDVEDNDETNILGAPQARKYDGSEKPYVFGSQETNIDAEYEQLSYTWYQNVDAETPTSFWSLGDDGDVVEGQAITGQGAVNDGAVLRLRMNLQANVATGTASSSAFALQYTASETCSTASGWQEIGKVGSSTAAFSGYNNASVDDGLILSSTTLASSTVFATYEEASLSEFNPNEIAPGEVAEWDWVLTSSNAAVNTNYCFRMVRSSGDELVTYTSYPELLTSGPPQAPTLLKRFDNEHANSLRPTFEFVASDPGGDDLQYQIQVDDDVSFGSTVLDRDSETNFLEFENIANGADKEPFTSGQTIRFTPTSDLTSSTTYWWRVRAIDPDGSNTYSDWSSSYSFTVNESLTVSEWFQTTDEQFETNSLTSATTSGSGSIEADIGGSTLVGEYGSVDVNVDVTGTTTVNLTNTFTDPVVVASVRYSRSIANGDQPIVRVFNKTATSFDVLASTFDFTSVGTTTVDWIVMEAGEALIDDGGSGMRVFATSTSVSAIEGANIVTDPVGATDIAFPTSFSSAPVVLAAVTTNNDPSFVAATVYDGNDITNPPTASQVSLYLNDSLASDGHGSAEDIDIIAFDPGSGVNDSINFATQVTATDVSDTPIAKTYDNTYSSVPGVILVQQRTMNGAQGGYAMVDIDTLPTNTDVTVAFEEGGTAGARTHANESLAIVSFESSSGDILRAGNAVVVSTPIDFDDAEVGNAWGELSFTDSGDVTYQIEYQTGSGFTLIPDTALPGNSTGFTTSPVNILDLDTDTYNELRLVASLSGVSPELFDWTVTWGQRVDIPTLGDPFDNEKIATTTPTFDFSTTDPQGDDLEYEISWSTDDTFLTGSTTRNSSTSSDFSPGNPYTSGATVTFTIPPGDALTDNTTYWWRVRAKDPNGGDSFSPWSDPDSFTVDTATLVSTWFQTTQEQFEEGTLDGVTASTTDSIEITTEVGEYGTTSVTNNDWTTINTQLTYNNMVVVASPEYAFNGTNNGRSVQVRNKTNSSFEIKADNYTESLSGATDVDYIVMEAGDWLITDGGSGIRFVAGTAESVSAVEGSGPGYTGGTQITFSPAFGSTPAALTTVSSANGSKWVMTTMDDGTAGGEITAASMYVALGVSLDTDTVRTPEDIDYIAFEQATGTNNGTLFDTFNTPNVVTESEAESTISFNQSFSTAPGVIVVQMNGTNGGDGGSAQVDTDTVVTSTEVDLTIAEHGATAGNHATEVVSLLAFEGESGTIRRESAATGGLTGTIASESILFSDGFGPKFERVLFSTTSPGNSSTSIQVQYQTSTSSWALIPDSQITNNSIGNTLSPIDLTSVDIVAYPVIRLYATLQCDTSNCPTLDDWSIEWSEGVPITGTIREYDRVTNVTSGTVRVAVNGTPGNTGTIAGDGTWSINNVTAFDGDTVTVWVDGASEADEAVAVFTYDGVGDMNNIQLFEQHLSISADENGTTTNADLSAYDNSVSGDEDIFFDVDGNNDLAVCAISGCSNANLYIGPGDIYIPDTSNSGNVDTHDFVNDGTFELDGNTMRVSGSWDNNATIDMTGSSVIFTSTSSSETIDDADNVLDFNNLTFGETSGTSTWKTLDPLDVDGDLAVDYGTFDRSSSTITVAGDVSTGVLGYWSGLSTTTFDGNSTAFWSDNNATLQDIGYTVIDGDTKLVFLSSDVLASNVNIGANDTLNAGGANTLNLTGNFTNTGTFVPQTGTVAIIGTSTTAIVDVGGSSFNNLTASTTGGGSVSFSTAQVTILGDLTIATGTVNLATATTSINGSFLNTGGFFAHNNAEVRFTSGGTETLELQGTEFFNHFYDVSFTGSGDWTFVDVNATTTNTFSISNGNVVLPSGLLTVARDFDTISSGSFDSNNGEVILLIEGNDTVTTNGSAFNDVRIREGSGIGNWYFEEWLYRIPITVRASEIDADLSSFPVYVDLADLDSNFFTDINIDGSDIRVTESDGQTEVPREVVNASTTALTGELYFEATSLSSTTDTTFYVYYGNATATDYAVGDTYGAEAVWSNSFVLVEHMNDLTSGTVTNSADGTFNGTKAAADNPLEVQTGPVYEAQEFDGATDSIAHGNIAGGVSQYSFSGWFNTDDLTGSGDTATFGYTLFGISPSGAPYQWLTVGGTGFTSEARICAYENSAGTCTGSSGAGLTTDSWYYIAVNAVDGGNTTIRINETQVLSYTNDGEGTVGANFTIGDLRPGRNIDFDGEVDEFRFSTATRTAAWHDATYRNQATTTDFYASGLPQENSVRTFADSNATIAGDILIETGTAVFPTGVLFVGGSFDNNDEFDANSGTVTFNSTTSAETIAAGNSSFYTVTFDDPGGDWTITEHATATNDIQISDASSFAVDLDVVLESLGTFTNDVANAVTSWAGATLKLSGDNSFSLNDKLNLGDSYNILTTTGDTDVSMWNSSAVTYNTLASSSIYSQDHDGIDGDLYIFGDYERETGTEYWSYNTDFDGADISGTPRQANIRIANTATVTASTSNFEIVGIASASTTVDAQSGVYTLLTNMASVTAQYFEMTGADANGFQLLSSTTVTLLDDAEFTIPGSSAAITVDATTIDTNPAAQYFNTDFVSGGGSVNVTLSGSPTSFWWFRDGTGDRYGEAFDNADGDPGSIRWDDSNYQINVSGTAYSDNGVTTLGGPTCDGVTNNIRIVVDGGLYTDAVPCNGLDGTFSFSNVSYGGDANIVVYLDTNGGTQGTVVTRTPTGDITDLDIYADQVIVRHENTATLAIADMIEYDNDDDTDVLFTATTTGSDTLTLLPGTGLYVWDNKEFVPDGVVDLQGGGNTSADGSLTIGSGATYTSTSTNSITVGGSMYVDAGGVFTGASSTVSFTATNTAQQIGSTGSSTITFYDLEFTGIGGDWAVQTPIISATDILVSTGTVSGVSDVTVQAGEFTGEGTVNMTGGEVSILRANTLGGSGEWTFYDLTLGDGVNSEVTVPASNATTTVRNTLTIATAHFLDAYGSIWDIQGSGATFVENGTFIQGTSTVRYSGATPNITQTPYYNLVLDPSGASTVATAPVTGLQVLGDLTVGALGTATLDLNTNDPLLGVSGDVYIGASGTIDASNMNVIDAFGNWDNDGVFTANGGTIDFQKTSGTAVIAAGNSDFANVDVTGAALFNFTESATATNDFLLDSTDFTLNAGQVLAVGGQFTNNNDEADTTWTGSTLSLYGGNAYVINPKTTSDTYATIFVSGNTHPRLWNSTTSVVTTEAGSSLYSQDHQGVSGDLYIFGDFVSSIFNDHWSYETDFDGTDLGVNDRIANVLIEAGGSVLYTGGSLTINGSTSATTTIAAQTAGTFDLTLGGTTTVDFGYYEVRDTTASGTVFTATPNVLDLSNGDFEVAIADGTAITVGGTAIDVNPALEFNFNRFATTTAINAYNVTATGTSVSAWRFVNVFGNLGGEAKDLDPGGDPGYITWTDSAAIINISGNVYQDEGSTVSPACDGVTANIRLSVNGSTFYDTTCDGGTGAYSFTGISYGLGNTLTVFIDDEAEDAVTVTQDPISSIAGFDLYENRVIIKHESAAPMTIVDMEIYDSDDDADILFDAEVAGTNVLTLPADTKLIVWDNKEFEPQGDVIIPGGGAGAAYDGTFELRDGAIFTGGDTEEYTIGGSLLSGTGATFSSAQSTTTFTTTGAGRTIDTNEGGFYNVTFTGSGSWTVSDTEFTVGNDLDKSAGALTLPNGTTTVGGDFTNTGGTFDSNSGTLVFTATDTGNDVTFSGSSANVIRFEDVGSWILSDTNATATGAFVVATGTVTFPSGVLAVGDDLIVEDTIVHNSGTVRLTGTGGGDLLTLNSNDLNNLFVVAGGGDYTQTDISAALLGDLIIQSGSYTAGTSTLSIGGSFDATAGTFVHSTGTVLFNSSDTGEIVDPGSNDFYNVTFAGAGGGWTIVDNATSTNNFTLSTGSSFTQATSTVLYVGGVFTNTLSGSATEWIGSTLVLDSGTEYSINLKTTPSEQYNILQLGNNTDISSWNSAATSTVVPNDSSLYSQDNAGVNGDLYIFGDYHIATTTEYWSYATDFDGVALGGSPRAVNVRIASSSVISIDGGALNVIGDVGSATTTIANQGNGLYTFTVTDGTFNADYYSFRNLDISGLQLSGTPTITSLSRGDFELSENNGELITLSSTTLDANASLIITDTRFDAAGFTGGRNVSLDATTTNSWSFTGSIGDLWGEAFDVDGSDDCSSIRWDDSDCLLTEQTNYRWRNDDGGEGAAPGTWYDSNWSARKRVRVINNDAQAYTNVAVKLDVVYDADMQSDFEDIRFTDSTGTVLIDHWTERFVNATDADVWVEVPSMATSSVTEIYMYYGNVSATSSSDVDAVFVAADDFEDNNITEYSGDTSLFATAGTYAFGGSYGLDASPNTSARATDGIARTDITVSQGEIFRFMQNVNLPAGSGDEVCTMFGVQNPVTNNQNYAVCLSPLRNRVALVEDVQDTDTSGTQLATSSITLVNGWYEVEVDWQTDGTMDVSVFDSSGALQATTSATDLTYTSGGVGFTFWFQNGGWDSAVSWPRTDTKPTARFGAEQIDGGASWKAAQDTPTGGYAIGETARLRIGIENTGLDITNQNFQLEYAPKLTAPSCQAVSGGSFSAVPTSGVCGGSDDICMTSSASTTNGDPTTDHLVTDAGDFVPGEIIADASNQTGNLDVAQNEYTELEYAINITANATNDAYCFRVTDSGSTLDSYALLPELTLAFDPILDTVVLNDGLDIALTPGATTTVTASTTVTDFNGFSDLLYATTTFYKTSVGAACTPDNNNCYVASSTACSFLNCSGSSCTLNCSADFQFHADPTDTDGAEEWFAFMEVEDSVGGVDFDTSIGVELLTLRAIEVLNAIGYGIIDVNQNTGTFNPNVTLNNLGNEPIDVQISGTDMTDGAVSVIPAAQQLYATSTFDYPACTVCNTLTIVGSTIEVDLNKPTTDSPPVSDDIYWGIEVPFGTASNPHSGINTFTAVAD